MSAPSVVQPPIRDILPPFRIATRAGKRDTARCTMIRHVVHWMAALASLAKPSDSEARSARRGSILRPLWTKNRSRPRCGRCRMAASGKARFLKYPSQFLIRNNCGSPQEGDY
jgi:hypothetical protein